MTVILKKDQEFLNSIKKTLAPFKAGVKRKAQGELPYDYLVPSGYYEEQWDWDAFFIGMALASDIPSEGIFLRNVALNLLHNSRNDGYIPGCITKDGPEGGHRSFLMKPFLAQGAYFASNFLKDFSWIAPHFSQLKTVVLYREKNVWNKKYNLGVWTNIMASGADNNVSGFGYPENSVVATDLNTFVYQEYKAMSLIAEQLRKTKEYDYFSKRASEIKNNINKYLWDESDGIYYNIDSRDGSFIKRVSYNSFHPLWAHIANKERTNKFIKNYVLNSKKLWSNYGIRTLAKDDKEYNNANIIKPYSNWQGPVWPIANYFAVSALLNYGFQKEAVDVAKKVAKLCLDDIKKTGGMHENYDAETGLPIAAPNFISWNLLVPVMLEDALTNKSRFAL
ncbi:MAG: hypothetical protein A3F31_02810 [Candidatus Levybacteria bacterium RIFCSPHIGHO2_12_FULL_38_12]|nr:MAG: hypothetical protein A2770_00940 [Candidatus Levybacteria bacterium RIFCSPHIGHO2_01_FULL_38_12]OGH22309.1 MAG: hypothetical protein A3D75_01955 [Candidatus Levybacteria bacterium RIFCSPHIGHO2_02_FULL_37_18]OGH22489.1 MAG: hypothetical protein A3F31_02810 [Candidatus Levybacteria bacterium RIFCSPHIGHO2_12_FULL_38_12]OGH33766.1 MAG: hypothetical protein A3A47_01195 [Candidatus Levybacteria bacterium RIFCSPLOWO2_01_FULL_37_20]OGH43466.1 MAG: hypothetical protein A3J14_01405 [Candidatus Lev